MSNQQIKIIIDAEANMVLDFKSEILARLLKGAIAEMLKIEVNSIQILEEADIFKLNDDSEFRVEYEPYQKLYADTRKWKESPCFAIYHNDDRIAETNKSMSKEKQEAIADLFAASVQLFEAAELADRLIKLIEKWADAEQEESYGIMDEIVAEAQDERKPEKAIAKAKGGGFILADWVAPR